MSSEMSKNTTLHIPSLDGIRAIAAALVFVAHAGFSHIIPGGFGVTVFFFLSGYLITTLLRVEYQDTGQINLRGFYLRRVYRILPPMYIVLAFAFVVGAVVMNDPGPAPGAVVSQVLQVTNYYMIVHGNQQVVFNTAAMWSLAIEEHFYLLYPLALITMLRRFSPRKIALILLGGCALVLAWRLVLVLSLLVGEDYTYMATDARIDSMLFGCAMAIGFNPALIQKSETRYSGWAIAALALSTLILIGTFLFRDEVFRQTVRYSIQGLALMPFFYCAVRYPHWVVFRWLEWPAIRGLGIISYTFYLVHSVVLAVCEKYLEGKLKILALAFSVAVGLSTVMYFTVERKMARLRKRLHSEISSAAAVGAKIATR